MATPREDELRVYERLMAQKLRQAAGDGEEFIQAAATQVVFHECIAIIGSIRTRLHFEAIKERAKATRTPPSLVLSDGSHATIGDLVTDGTRCLGRIVQINPKSIYLSADPDIHRKVIRNTPLFAGLRKQSH